jgi:hypothetical protein
LAAFILIKGKKGRSGEKWRKGSDERREDNSE